MSDLEENAVKSDPADDALHSTKLGREHEDATEQVELALEHTQSDVISTDERGLLL